MTLREKIEDAMHEYADVYERAMNGFTWDQKDVQSAQTDAVNDILAAVREAMLICADGFIVAKDENGKSLGAVATKPWMEQILAITGIAESEVEYG